MPAIESGTSPGLFSAMSAPIGMTRRNTSYDEHMDAPMNSPPSDLTVNIFWKDPVIPQHKFRNTAEEGESGVKMPTFEAALPAKSPVPVVKAKATSLMNSLMIKHTQENLQRFEHQAGLTDTGYSPHKGLSAEETRFHRRADGTLPVSMNIYEALMWPQIIMENYLCTPECAICVVGQQNSNTILKTYAHCLGAGLLEGFCVNKRSDFHQVYLFRHTR